jgi:hypothetical protein
MLAMARKRYLRENGGRRYEASTHKASPLFDKATEQPGGRARLPLPAATSLPFRF